MSPRKLLLSLCAVVVVLTGVWLLAQGRDWPRATVELLNVSYDVSRELWTDLNAAFIPTYEQRTGLTMTIRQSHAGSSSQARKVVDGLEADVVTLNLFTDTDLLRQRGLIPAGWEGRLPNNSLPYTSTIVFVVRSGNPKAIKDWSDLLKPDVAAITPNPKTSGLGKLSFLAAWASVVGRGGSDEDASRFVKTLFTRIPVLDSGGRGATTTFSQKGIGDVHLTFENEARLEAQEAGGSLEIVYPTISILAEPYVTLVDSNVDRHGTRQVAEEYLQFLYTQDGQEIIARHFLRPSDPTVLARHAEQFPRLELVPITAIASGWEAALQRFFAEGAMFDQIFERTKANGRDR